jgi:hypothetical protein
MRPVDGAGAAYSLYGLLLVLRPDDDLLLVLRPDDDLLLVLRPDDDLLLVLRTSYTAYYKCAYANPGLITC